LTQLLLPCKLAFIYHISAWKARNVISFVY